MCLFYCYSTMMSMIFFFFRFYKDLFRAEVYHFNFVFLARIKKFVLLFTLMIFFFFIIILIFFYYYYFIFLQSSGARITSKIISLYFVPKFVFYYIILILKLTKSSKLKTRLCYWHELHSIIIMYINKCNKIACNIRLRISK